MSSDIDENEAGDADLPDTAANRAIRDRALRLKEAVKLAGGVKAVAQRSNIPFGTINHYMSGREMKAASMIALAQACQVSLEWLATGAAQRAVADASVGSEQQLRRDQVHMHVYAPGAKLFETLDMDRFGAAIEAATERFAASNASPRGREMGMVIALFYDGFSSPDDGQRPSLSPASPSPKAATGE